jgi:hypothetical protein
MTGPKPSGGTGTARHNMHRPLETSATRPPRRHILVLSVPILRLPLFYSTYYPLNQSQPIGMAVEISHVDVSL